uniref:Uncharacterized protein n=1 Tax=Chromera velia CCMP2878 TaxID=1169474 RepID=A0A0G4H8E3_9ALVE|eukprot:Cvel_25136.t1-p1 / transcript=Cvel_25136.t1 / gene=Cvel_25136 / organism=Chromera_velia_CCMP2878 / gene_product=hypothetical protein / transcript_product=hypothetical protein / location=Cvel_scaffold2809:19297-22089(+) / protein_length=215 / sequence_SO=supercontig / SO=protein_coding / is_pseudo=false
MATEIPSSNAPTQGGAKKGIGNMFGFGGGSKEGANGGAGGAPAESLFKQAQANANLEADPIAAEERKKNARDNWDDGVEDLQVIPDLDQEQEQEEDITRQVAAPPVIAEQKLKPVSQGGPSKDVRSRLPPNPEPNVDLTLLMVSLCPDVQAVTEDDVQWEREQIFQEMAAIFAQPDSEASKQPGDKDGTGKGTAGAGGKAGVSVTSQGVFYDAPY